MVTIYLLMLWFYVEEQLNQQSIEMPNLLHETAMLTSSTLPWKTIYIIPQVST